MYNGIKVDGVLYKTDYNVYKDESTIIMYADSHKRIPRIAGLTIINDSDSMTDYFETDTVRIAFNDKYYNEAKKAYVLYLKKRIETVEKRIANGKRYSIDIISMLKLSLERATA
jgi:hypothetical protein